MSGNKHININKFWDFSPRIGWVDIFCLCVLLSHLLWRRKKHINKNCQKIPGQFRKKIVGVTLSSVVLFAPKQLEDRQITNIFSNLCPPKNICCMTS